MLLYASELYYYVKFDDAFERYPVHLLDLVRSVSGQFPTKP